MTMDNLPWGLADGNTGASIGDHGGIVAQDTHADL